MVHKNTLRNRRLRESRRRWLDIYKRRKGCEICGYNHKAVALHFDHKYPNEKKRAVAHMMNCKLTKLINEIRKCRILCANCHYIETDKERKLMQKDLFETPTYKLHRSNDPSTSREAASALNVSRMEKIVLAAIDSFGKKGCISDEVLEILPSFRYSTVTARYKQLKEKGLVLTSDLKRKGKSGRYQFVMWSKENGVED